VNAGWRIPKRQHAAALQRAKKHQARKWNWRAWSDLTWRKLLLGEASGGHYGAGGVTFSTGGVAGGGGGACAGTAAGAGPAVVQPTQPDGPYPQPVGAQQLADAQAVGAQQLALQQSLDGAQQVGAAWQQAGAAGAQQLAS
jgi:hypothetical protein